MAISSPARAGDIDFDENPALKSLAEWDQWALSTSTGPGAVDKAIQFLGTSQYPMALRADGVPNSIARLEFQRRNADGYAFILRRADPFSVFTIADSVEPDGTLSPWAEPHVGGAKCTYGEVAADGRSLTIIGKGEPPGSDFWYDPFTFSTSDAFVVLTGNRMKGFADEITDPGKAFEKIYEGYGSTRQQSPSAGHLTPDDRVILAQSYGNARDAGFISLFDLADCPDGCGSMFCVDRSLIRTFANAERDNVDQIDRLMRASEAMRPMWDEIQGGLTYGQRAIRSALAVLAEEAAMA